MGFLPYDYKLQDKIESSDVWRLKTDIYCEEGFYEKGSRLFSKDIIICLYDNDTQECILKEKNATSGMEIKINANDFEKYFEVDHQMNDIIKEKNKAKEERDLSQGHFEVGFIISGLLFLGSALFGAGYFRDKYISDISIVHLLLYSLIIFIFILGTLIYCAFSSKADKRYDKIMKNLEDKEQAYLSENVHSKNK